MFAIFLFKYLNTRQRERENCEDERVLRENFKEIDEFHQAESMDFCEKHENFLHKTQEFKTLPEYLFEVLSQKYVGVSLRNLDFFAESLNFSKFNLNLLYNR